MRNEAGQRTFRDLDGGRDDGSAPFWALEMWYDAVRDIKIADMSVDDLARACRQGLFIEIIVPFALVKLEENPLAGEMYEGQVVQNLKELNGDYWRTHPWEREKFLALAQRAYHELGDRNLIVAENDLLRS